jgi:glutathione synthase/RimK-type ligase-like ATP-grasp enzyme
MSKPTIGIYISTGLYWSDRSERAFIKALMSAIEKSGTHTPLRINLRKLNLQTQDDAQEFCEQRQLVGMLHHASPYFVDDEAYAKSVELLEERVPFISSSHSHSIAHDKLKTKELLRAHAVPVLPEKIVRTLEELERVTQSGEWYVVKPLREGAGKGVKLIQNKKGEIYLHSKNKWGRANFSNTSEGILLVEKDFLWDEKCLYSPMMVEPYFNDDREGFSSLRVTVIGGEAVEGVKRVHKKSITSNVALGGKARKFLLTPLQEKIAVDAARIVGAEFAGVDLLTRGEETVVGEINIGPITTFSSYTGVDVTKLLAVYIIKKTQS